jgi:hypothetical protein
MTNDTASTERGIEALRALDALAKSDSNFAQHGREWRDASLTFEVWIEGKRKTDATFDETRERGRVADLAIEAHQAIRAFELAPSDERRRDVLRTLNACIRHLNDHSGRIGR